MDLTQLELNALAILWQASNGDLALRTNIENELQARIANNEIYSREYLFRVSHLQNHAVGINFIPSSESYLNYGANVTVSILLNDEEINEIGQNHFANPQINTYGNVKATVLVEDNLTPNQIADLATEGFNTSDILTLIHL